MTMEKGRESLAPWVGGGAVFGALFGAFMGWVSGGKAGMGFDSILGLIIGTLIITVFGLVVNFTGRDLNERKRD